MIYTIEFKPNALKFLKTLDKPTASVILDKIYSMKDNLKGDIKKLTNFTPEYRLRVGNYRVLFEIENSVIIVYSINHRREVYK